MSYKKAAAILPSELLEEIQTYVDGAYLYIPRLEENRKAWGSDTQTRRELAQRNQSIYSDHLAGHSTSIISAKHFLSQKSVQRIIRKERSRHCR